VGEHRFLNTTKIRRRAMLLAAMLEGLVVVRGAQITNEALREAALEMRIDHRSLAARGIDREPARPHPS
jgi:hypothetical protein